MLHTKYQGSMPFGFSQEDILSFFYIHVHVYIRKINDTWSWVNFEQT
jgi:hypothetical protein